MDLKVLYMLLDTPSKVCPECFLYQFLSRFNVDSEILHPEIAEW